MTGHDPFDDIGDYFDGEEEISKSAVKREMHERQALGQELAELSARELEKIELPDSLLNAIEAYKKITSNVAKRRQLQFIGRVMRDVEVEPIEKALHLMRHGATMAAQQHHNVERWRDRILSEGDTAINAFIEQFPQSDRQKLRQLERSARKETEQNKPPASARELFRYLREQLSEQ